MDNYSSNNFKTWSREIIWILLSVLITFLLSLLLFGRNIFQETVNIEINNNTIAMQSRLVIISFFIVFTFITYLFKEKKWRYQRKFQNIMIIVLGSFLIIIISRLTGFLSHTITEAENISLYGKNLGNGWTVFPPSAHTQNIKPLDKTSLLQNAAFLSTFLQLFVLLLLISLSYKWGKYGSIQKVEDK